MCVMSILQRLTGPNIFLLIPGCCYILLLHTAIMGCYLLLFLLLSLQHHEGTCCNRNHAVYGKCGFILNAHGNYSWCHLGAAERRRACVTYEWAGSLRRLNDHSGWGGVRWGDGDMGEWTGCVCRVSLLLCVKGCWCSSRRSHTVPHTAGMGCYNVTHGEDPHLTLCQHCGEASHTYMHAHAWHTLCDLLTFLSLWEQYLLQCEICMPFCWTHLFGFLHQSKHLSWSVSPSVHFSPGKSACKNRERTWVRKRYLCLVRGCFYNMRNVQYSKAVFHAVNKVFMCVGIMCLEKNRISVWQFIARAW